MSVNEGVELLLTQELSLTAFSSSIWACSHLILSHWLMQITSALSHAPSSRLPLPLSLRLKQETANFPASPPWVMRNSVRLLKSLSSQTCHMNLPFASTWCWEQRVVWISRLVWVLSRKGEMDFALRPGICQCFPGFKQGWRERIRDPPYINFLAYPLIIPS